MTVTTTNSFTGPLYPNGLTLVFPFTFKASSAEEVIVEIDGVLQSGYTVTLDTDQGGSVTFDEAPSGTGLVGGPALYIYSDPDFLQESRFETEGAFNPVVFNELFDKLAVATRWCKDRLDKLMPPQSLLSGALAGYFLAWDAEGNPVASAGTGADTGLRTDLAASGGAALLSTIRPEAPAVQRLLSKHNNEIVYAKDYAGDSGSVGQYAYDFTQNFRDMVQYAPAGAILEFSHGMDTGGEFKVTDTITITKHLSLKGRNSRIVGAMADNTKDLIRYVPDAEVRGIEITGLRLAFNSGGRHALYIGNSSVGFLNAFIAYNKITGGAGGYGLKLEGQGTHFNNIFGNAITGAYASAGAVHLACADGTSFLHNQLSGIGVGMLVELINGSYKTLIQGGSITSRDNGVYLAAAQQIDIIGVQFEQGTSYAADYGTNENQAATYKAHIVMFGAGEYSAGEQVRDIRVVGNNFGSGSNQDTSIILPANTFDISIDENVFANVGDSGVDIQILSATCKHTEIGNRNRVYGNRGVGARGTANTTDPRDLLLVSDSGTGTLGVTKGTGATGINVQNSWTGSSRFAFWKEGRDRVCFRGSLVAGTVTAGTTIGTLPAEFRPGEALRLVVPTNTDDDYAMLAIATDGVITVRSVPAAATIYMDGVSFPARKTSYLSGPF